MKNRLQFRFNDSIFSTRDEALAYLNETFGKKTELESLVAEPLAMFYGEPGNVNAILCIGKPGERTGYFTLDTAELSERADAGDESISGINSVLEEFRGELGKLKATDESIKKGVGLNDDGTFTLSDTSSEFLKGAKDVLDALYKIDKIVFENDKNLKEVTGVANSNKDDIGKLKSDIEALSGNTVNGKKISGNPVLSGEDIALDGYIKPSMSDAKPITEIDSVNDAFGKLEAKADDNASKIKKNEVVSSDNSINIDKNGENTKLSVNIDNSTIGLNEKNGIEVNIDNSTLGQNDQTKKIEVNIDNSTLVLNKQTKKIEVALSPDDKILNETKDGLIANIYLEFPEKSQRLYLKGKNGSILSDIDVSSFLKDGMLDSATFDNKTNKIKLVFNTDSGKSGPIEIDVASLVDEYTAGNGLQLDSKSFSVKVNGTADNLLKSNADGVSVLKSDVVETVTNGFIANVVDGISPEEVKDQTLLRKIKGTDYFYVSTKNDARNIAFDAASVETSQKEDYNTVQNALEKALSRIEELEKSLARVKELEDRIKFLEANAITSIDGIGNEIKVDGTGNSRTLGFDENVIFRAEIDNNPKRQ